MKKKQPCIQDSPYFDSAVRGFTGLTLAVDELIKALRLRGRLDEYRPELAEIARGITEINKVLPVDYCLYGEKGPDD